MRTLISLSILALACLSSEPAHSGAVGYKDPVGCSGPNQTYNYSWSYDPGGYSIYTAKSKKSGPNTWYTEHTATPDAYCKFVGRGLPHGSFTHNWQTTGGSELTNFTNFYNAGGCNPLP